MITNIVSEWVQHMLGFALLGGVVLTALVLLVASGWGFLRRPTRAKRSKS